ncbi:uncharacterized protein LOC133717172 isoform X2 [Rosa rugosa]|uniref:uncharacterized protein LOC133717172 isoform X2 n=1 Tax=Rosa rugosa TaxID=74645 RepID=UPI002B413BD5|nr:uncharacterized protein LOC133717172 isoform X2 [Rosa rugosa]
MASNLAGDDLSSSVPPKGPRPPSTDLPPLECTYCGDKGHTEQRCYELVGYLEWWDFIKKPRKNIDAKKSKGVATTTKEPPSANIAQSGHSDPVGSWLWC